MNKETVNDRDASNKTSYQIRKEECCQRVGIYFRVRFTHDVADLVVGTMI